MSKKSKVIRATVSGIFLLVLAIVIIVLTKDSYMNPSSIKIELKIYYAVALVISILGYGLLKNRLVKMNIKKGIEYIYRYIYLFLVTIGTRLIAAYIYKKEILNDISLPIYGSGIGGYIVRFIGDSIVNQGYAPLIINTVIAFAIAVCIKRIMFNITMNEILSSITAIIYLFMPLGITSTVVYTSQIFNTLFILLGIYLTLKMIDEVKQHKLNNLKYIYFALLISIFGVFDLLFGGTIYLFGLVALATMLIGDNIDYLQINFKKNFVDKFDIKIKKMIYRIERIKISKLIIGLSIVILVVLLSGTILSLVVNNSEIFKISDKLDLNIAWSNVKACFGESRNYYIIAFSLIVVLEILGKILNRKKDTKSTYLKIIFVIALGISSINHYIYNVYIMDVVTSMLLMLNLGNIYYNREEKIKLLKESKN